MPGRRRFQVRIHTDDPEAARTAMLPIARSGDVRFVDHEPAIDEDGVAAVDVRVRRDRDAAALRGLARGLSARSDARLIVREHECFHGLEDEPDFRPCRETVETSIWLDGVLQEREPVEL